jgi:hypothetical protein
LTGRSSGRRLFHRLIASAYRILDWCGVEQEKPIDNKSRDASIIFGLASRRQLVPHLVRLFNNSPHPPIPPFFCCKVSNEAKCIRSVLKNERREEVVMLSRYLWAAVESAFLFCVFQRNNNTIRPRLHLQGDIFLEIPFSGIYLGSAGFGSALGTESNFRVFS